MAKLKNNHFDVERLPVKTDVFECSVQEVFLIEFKPRSIPCW